MFITKLCRRDDTINNVKKTCFWSIFEGVASAKLKIVALPV